MTADYRVRDDIAVITLANPPVNGLGAATRAALADALGRAERDDAVGAIVIVGAGTVFSGGADIREFASPLALAEPTLHTVIRLIEACAKPVIAAIHGVCMGGGLELALACHYRVAAPGADIALPEVKLGLLPGAGGTQRLPRVLDVETALNMIVSGQTAKAERLFELPGQRLFDQMIDGELIDGAVLFARDRARAHAAGAALPLVRQLQAVHANADAYFQFARTVVKNRSRHFPAPPRCVDCVEQAVKAASFDDGLAFEREAFVALMRTPESKALRHAFFGARAATKIADVPADTPRRAIHKVAVIGAGTMGGGIAMTFLNAGLPVTLLEPSTDALDRGVATIRKNYDAQLRKGKLTQAVLDRRLALLSTTLSYDDISDADLVIEAVYEEMRVKAQVFEALDGVMKPGAILASNTSTLDLNQIAATTRRPQDVVGLHFFSPANVMKLLEVVRGEHTAADVLATVMALARTIGKTAVVAGVCDGFIGNRMIEQYLRQAGFLLDEGCTPQQVDRAIEAFGFAMGPFRMADLAGNDIGWAIRKRRAGEKPNLRYSRTADLLCELGRFGQKTSAGWYDYAPGRREPRVSDQVDEMIARHRDEIGITPRRIADVEIVERLVYALVNEGARILDEGIAAKASDIDIVYLNGYGFPAHRGGPMCHADQQGLYNVLHAMQRFARNPHADPDFWQPAPLLARLAAQGRGFTDPVATAARTTP